MIYERTILSYFNKIRNLEKRVQKLENCPQWNSPYQQDYCDAMRDFRKYQKSGKWIALKNRFELGNRVKCSECGQVFVVGDDVSRNFCPNCGACMKEGRTLDEFIEDSKESEE